MPLYFILASMIAGHPCLHHIPKTAGTSARKTLNELGSWNIGHTELCFHQIARSCETVGFIRTPSHQVFSQFLECKYDTWGKQMTRTTNFPRNLSDADGFHWWLRHFESSTDNFRCYHPFNMQTRSFLPNCTDTHRYNDITPHLAKVAIRRMHDLDAVGITEHFKLSICVIMYIITGHLLGKCHCPSEWVAIHDAHNVPAHSVYRLNSSTMRMVHENTAYDHVLYVEAQQKFWKQVEMVEQKTQKSLECFYQ